MDISGAFNAQAAEVAASSPQGVVETSRNVLGQDDFFKLLTTQLTAQDPLEPMDNTEFIAQMAQFSSLTQMEAIAQNTEASKARDEANSVLALIGKLIEAEGADGETISGIINRVNLVDGEMVPFIGDTKVKYDSITNISNPSDEPPSASVEEPPTVSLEPFEAGQATVSLEEVAEEEISNEV